jgi:hypothetical protein
VRVVQHRLRRKRGKRALCEGRSAFDRGFSMRVLVMTVVAGAKTKLEMAKPSRAEGMSGARARVLKGTRCSGYCSVF